jgi:hypothetical protein
MNTDKDTQIKANADSGKDKFGLVLADGIGFD